MNLSVVPSLRVADNETGVNGTMTEHHREGESASAIVGHARAATGALTFLKDWIGVIALLIGLGWEMERVVGKIETAESAFNARFTAIEKSMDDFKAEVRDRLKSTGSEASNANSDVRELRGRVETAQKDIDGLKHDVSENFKIMMTYEAKKK